MNAYELFKQLHDGDELLHLGNVWDVTSALMFAQKGYRAIGTSSGALAGALGFEDGEQIPFEVLCNTVKQIVDYSTLPLSVDIEGGYSRDLNTVIEHLYALYDVGVVGVNLEDSLPTTHSLKEACTFAKEIEQIQTSLKQRHCELFLNIRIDCYLLGIEGALEESLMRIKHYEAAGADGIFIPCVVDEEAIKILVASTSLPLNVMAMPNLPSLKRLEALGVRRVSQGPFLFQALQRDFENRLRHIAHEGNFSGLF